MLVQLPRIVQISRGPHRIHSVVLVLIASAVSTCDESTVVNTPYDGY
jgi:hypothetical protein